MIFLKHLNLLFLYKLDPKLKRKREREKLFPFQILRNVEILLDWISNPESKALRDLASEFFYYHSRETNQLKFHIKY